MTLWQARLSAGPAETLLKFTSSLSFDVRLAPFDLAASVAHVNGLARGGLLTEDERTLLVETLQAVGGELVSGNFDFEPGDEDIHTAIERRVTALCGDVGAKLHTGRSRNDQVATAVRLFTRYELLDVVAGILRLQEAFASKAVGAADSYMPGYTHLQRAQPVLISHHFLAHGWALARDIDRMLDCVERADSSPLGAGALAGSSLRLDPAGVAAELGFSSSFENSLDAVSDRDFVAEALFDLSMLALHLSRIGEEIIIWSSEEFGFVALADSYSTGSSMLPQKKNPDIAELGRGKSGRLIGNLAGLLSTLKGLPLSYNRDLQEDKEPLFDSIDQMKLALAAFAPMIETMTLNLEKMSQAADSPYGAAIDVAEWLVARGMPFRQAHSVVAELVRQSIDSGTELAQIISSRDDLGPEAAALLSPGVPVSRRTSPGGAGPLPVARQAEQFASRMETDVSRLEAVAAPIRAIQFPGWT